MAKHFMGIKARHAYAIEFPSYGDAKLYIDFLLSTKHQDGALYAVHCDIKQTCVVHVFRVAVPLPVVVPEQTVLL